MLVSSLGANPASEYRLPSSPPPPFTPSPYAADDVPDPSEFLVDCDTLLYAPLRLCRSRYRRSSLTAMIPHAQRRASPPPQDGAYCYPRDVVIGGGGGAAFRGQLRCCSCGFVFIFAWGSVLRGCSRGGCADVGLGSGSW